MKKGCLLLGLIMMSGCAGWFGDTSDTVLLSPNENIVVLEDETEPAVSAPANVPTEPVSADPTEIVPAAVSAPAEMPPVVTVSDDGVIEIPAQRISLKEVGIVLPPAESELYTSTTPVGSADRWLAYSEPSDLKDQVQTETQQTPRVPTAVVTLQDPNRPNSYAQCLASNQNCVRSYEEKGYRRVRGLPHFAGYRDVLAPSDYPAGSRWRHNNNIPRW